MDDRMADRRAVANALREGGLIDITTTGRRTGQPRRIEIVLHDMDGRLYISGMPARGRRSWLANLESDPRMTVHLKRRPVADVPARARIIDDPGERRRVLDRVTRTWGRTAQLDAFVAASPLIEVIPEDWALLAGEASAAGGATWNVTAYGRAATPRPPRSTRWLRRRSDARRSSSP